MLQRLAGLWFRLKGWRVEGSLPASPKFVAIGAPHTSNWDGVAMLAVMERCGVKPSFMGKHTLFRWPLGRLMRKAGGIAIRRDVRASVVEQMAHAFARSNALVLVIAPEGTRSRAPHWRSGFYHIALTAGVPIVPAAIDYPARRAVIGPPIVPTGDVRADMEIVRAFYTDGEGKYPEKATPIRLAEEV